MSRKLNKILCSLSLVIPLSLTLIGCEKIQKAPYIDDPTHLENIAINSKVHFIDTGNSDSILVENNNEYLLIDAGDNDDDEKIISYLKNEGVTELKYVVMTHPHADHIGGMDSVIKAFDISKLISGQGIANTTTYEKVLNEAKNKGYKLYAPKDGEKLQLGSGILEFYNAQNREYGNELNNSSVVVKYTNGEDDFLFMGDAEKEIENNIKDKIGDIEVLKAGHHGSSSSSSLDFIKAITPEDVVILCGKDNKYGHPHKEVLEEFNNLNINIYRSDEDGDIIFESNGDGEPKTTSSPNNENNSEVNKETSNIEVSDENIVYFTEKGKSYHKTKDCTALSRSKNILSDTLENAINKGKSDPCDKCYK